MIKLTSLIVKISLSINFLSNGTKVRDSNFKKLPTYKLISNTGPRHKPIFKVAVKLLNTKFYSAEGKSKKDAEQNAAILCLQSITKL